MPARGIGREVSVVISWSPASPVVPDLSAAWIHLVGPDVLIVSVVNKGIGALTVDERGRTKGPNAVVEDPVLYASVACAMISCALIGSGRHKASSEVLKGPDALYLLL